MISKGDVIRLIMPFPNIPSDLAVIPHMYICHCITGNTVKFVKCQSVKPYMLSLNPMSHYWDESPCRCNPFRVETRIDCDKEFVTYNVEYDEKLKTTTRRPNVCAEVMSHIDTELSNGGYTSYNIDECSLINMNSLVRRIG